MSEVKGHEPEFKPPKNSYEQPVLHEELGPELAGLEYWTKEYEAIARGAFARIHTIQETGAHMPGWAKTIQNNHDSMRRAGQIFQKHLIEDSEAIDYGHTLERHHTTVGSIKDWYRRLGPTNESEDLVRPLLGAVDTLAESRDTIDRNYLMGNLLEDVALRTEDSSSKISLLKEAAAAYKSTEKRGGIHEHQSRAALRQGLDCEHLILAEQYKIGEVSEGDYYEKYEELQERSAQAFIYSLDKKNNVDMGAGEALEWASLLYARHHYWSDQKAEQYIVRAALLREDQAIYPWRAEGGKNPIWSFDTVVTDQATNTVKTRIQLKAGELIQGSDRERMYLPTVVDTIRSEKPSHEMRDFLLRGSTAIINTYEVMRMKDTELANRIMIDQEAIDTVEALFGKVLA